MIANPRAEEALDSCTPARGSSSLQRGTIRSICPIDVDSAAFRPMKVQRNEVKFRALPAGPAGGWRVEIWIGTDHLQYIYGFDSQFDADEWIERESEEWMNLLRAKL
jgi:hypothetical protein